jgi:hypothetical protein
MLDFHKVGDLDVNPVAITYNSIVNAWANSCDLSQQEGKPKQSWANSCDLSAGKRAEAILDQMLEFHEAGDPDVNCPRYFHFQHYI